MLLTPLFTSRLILQWIADDMLKLCSRCSCVRRHHHQLISSLAWGCGRNVGIDICLVAGMIHLFHAQQYITMGTIFFVGQRVYDRSYVCTSYRHCIPAFALVVLLS